MNTPPHEGYEETPVENPPRPARQSIKPTYDGSETGPRYFVTYRIDGRTITSRKRIEDPFIRGTLYVSWWDRLKSLLRRDMVVQVLVDGDPDVVEDVLELNADYLGLGHSTRRAEYRASLHAAMENCLSGPDDHDGERA